MAGYFARQVARRLDVPVGEVGTAGLKDRHAVTRQMVSEPDLAEGRLSQLDGDGIRLLSVSCHGNKLKPGPPAKPGGDPSSGISSGDVLIPTEWHPACRQREARLGYCTERENLTGDAKGKGTSGSNREAESTDALERDGLPRSSDEAAVMPWSEGGGSPKLNRTNRQREKSKLNGRRQPSNGGTSRMMREYQVRICERLRVKCPGPTRQQRRIWALLDTSVVALNADICLRRNI